MTTVKTTVANWSHPAEADQGQSPHESCQCVLVSIFNLIEMESVKKKQAVRPVLGENDNPGVQMAQNTLPSPMKLLPLETLPVSWCEEESL